MIKSILAPAFGAESDERVCASALVVAGVFGAHVAFLHVAVDVPAVAMAAGDASAGAAKDRIAALQSDETASETRALATVTRLCASAGVPLQPTPPASGASADFLVETGPEAESIAAHGRFADLIVLGRTRDGVETITDVIEQALLDTARPLLIVPTTVMASLFGTIVIAWSDTPEAYHAMHLAKPFLARAARIVVLCIDPDDATLRSAEQLVRALRWMNANTSLRREARGGGPPIDTLLKTAQAIGASLLVMGGYGHTPLRELLFGGMTRSVLGGADIPVLISH